jgi:hypothetical protein
VLPNRQVFLPEPVKLMRNIEILRVSAPGWYPQAAFQNKRIQVQHGKLSAESPFTGKINTLNVKVKQSHYRPGQA